MISSYLHNKDKSFKRSEDNVNVREFLVSHLIVAHRNRVFEDYGHLEETLFSSSEKILEKFEMICGRIQETEGNMGPGEMRTITQGFIQLLSSYLIDFSKWKIPDQEKLLRQIKHALVALYQAHNTLPQGNEQDIQGTHTCVNGEIYRLRNKLIEIRGPEYLRQFEESVRNGSVPIPVKENGTTSPTQTCSQTLQDHMTNEQLAHELLLDPTFQLDETGNPGYRYQTLKQIRQCLQKAFWESIKDDLKLSPPDFSKMIRILDEIRGAIHEMAGDLEKHEINMIIDIPYIRDQTRQGLFGWTSLTALVNAVFQVCKKVQAPKRDDQTKSMFLEVQTKMAEASTAMHLQGAALCQALDTMLIVVNFMRIDGANARLRLIAPVVIQHGVEYQQEKFEDKLRSGTLTLQRTEQAIGNAVNTMARYFPQSIDFLKNTSNEQAVKMCYTLFITEIFNGPPIKTDNIPETLIMDVHRLAMYQRKVQYFATIANICARLKHNVGSSLENTVVRLEIQEIHFADNLKIDYAGH